MRRTTLNFAVEIVTFLAALGMIATGLIVRWVLPPGSGSRRELWSLTRHEWGDVHFWLAVGLVVLAVVHIALHWNWVCAVAGRWVGRRGNPDTHRDRIRRNAYGAALLVVIFAGLAAFVWIAQSSVVENSGAGLGRQTTRTQSLTPDMSPAKLGP